METQDVYTDTLFVGLTRPATMWGVPLHAFAFEFMATVIVFLGVGNPIYLLAGIPIHAIIYLISVHDAAIFGMFFVWVQTSGRCVNASFWKAVSFSPLPLKRWDVDW